MKTIIINIIFFLAFSVTFSQVVNDNETNFPQEGSINESIWNSYLIQGTGAQRTIRLGVSNDGYTRGEIEIENNNTAGSSIYLKTTNTNGGAVERMFIASNGNIGIGTTTPVTKLDVEDGDLYVGEEVSSNGSRRQIRVYGFDNSAKFYGSMHSNYDDGKRTFDINTNNYVQQIKIDASANSTANIILNPGILGNIGIGTTTPDSKLSVNGNIHAKEVRVDLIGWPDYVFNFNYNLPTLKEVEQHIKDKGHLKDIPSAEEVKENGIFLGEMNSKLLQKIEELTLYTINQEKRIEALESKNEKLLLLVEKLLNKKIEE